MSDERDIVFRAVDYLVLNAAESGADVLIAELSDEILRLRGAKTAALKLADERAIEAVELRAKLAEAEQESVPKEFNDANIRVAREFKERAEKAEAQLEALKAIDLARAKQYAGARMALEAAKEFADDEFSDCGDLNRKNRISRLCDTIDAALTSAYGKAE